mmetsp:Transcript_28396/g.60851  ORF Transcript_28396/g.60851 Transcript_28396/m.60851 type:complete len:103 (+) Transcript_28396:214-522(+)
MQMFMLLRKASCYANFWSGKFYTSVPSHQHLVRYSQREKRRVSKYRGLFSNFDYSQELAVFIQLIQYVEFFLARCFFPATMQTNTTAIPTRPASAESKNGEQ